MNIRMTVTDVAADEALVQVRTRCSFFLSPDDTSEEETFVAASAVADPVPQPIHIYSTFFPDFCGHAQADFVFVARGADGKAQAVRRAVLQGSSQLGSRKSPSTALLRGWASAVAPILAIDLLGLHEIHLLQ